MVGCLVEEFIKENFGEEKLRKLNNMHQGGKNNEKGNRLEDRFAVFKVVSLAPLMRTSEPDLILSKQEKGFVDDIVITFPNMNKKENYQAKDAKDIAWSAFVENFQMQHSLDVNHHGYTQSWTNALLAEESQYIKLSKKIPPEIQHHTECVFFPNDESLPSLIMRYKPLKDGLADLSKKKDDLSHYETIFAQILGQWSVSENGRIADILQKSKDNARPNLFINDRVLQFDDKALQYLDQIQNLEYSLDNDELSIRCNGFNFTLASVQLGNVEQCEVLLKQKRPKALIELIEIWQALSTVHG